MNLYEKNINSIAELKDKKLEKVYFSDFIFASRKMLAVAAILFGGLFFLMVVFNIAVMGLENAFLDVILRLIVLILSIFVFFVVKKSSNNYFVINSFMSFLIVFIIIYQILFIVNDDTTLMDRAISFVVIMFATFLVPMRWIHSLLFAIGMAVMFTVCSVVFWEPGAVYQLLGVIIYFCITILIGAIFSYNINVYRRLQFVKESELEMLSVTDTLTNTYNRQMVNDTLESWGDSPNEEVQPISIVMFDLDDFKLVNDNYGHHEGDRVLVACADLVKENLRKSDILARWGGEEFMILLPCTPLDQAVEIAERLRGKIESKFSSKEYTVTASFGVTQRKQDDTNSSLLVRVDKKMYKAKEIGKNQVVSE